jgi:hypothetical protein
LAKGGAEIWSKAKAKKGLLARIKLDKSLMKALTEMIIKKTPDEHSELLWIRRALTRKSSRFR